jgi:hypothetical protein
MVEWRQLPSQLHFTGLIPNELARSTITQHTVDLDVTGNDKPQNRCCAFTACIKPALFTQHYRIQSPSLPKLLPVRKDCLRYKLTASTHLLHSEKSPKHTRVTAVGDSPSYRCGRQIPCTMESGLRVLGNHLFNLSSRIVSRRVQIKAATVTILTTICPL